MMINLMILAACVLVLELVFGSWFSDVHALHSFTKPRDMVLTVENPLSNGPAQITYTRDKNGFRGLDGPVDAIDIVTVGGSTTDQRYLDDDDTYQANMRRLFLAQGQTVSIANAGIDGQTTFGHIQNFPSWFDRVDGLRTDWFLYFIGINDLLRLQDIAEYDRLSAQSPRLRLQLFIREKSAFYQMYLILKQAMTPGAPGHMVSLRYNAVEPPFADAPLLTDIRTPEMNAALKALKKRVVTLAQLSEGFGARAIFVTQGSATWKRLEGGIVGIRQPDSGFRAELMDHYGPMNGLDYYNVERLIADAILQACAETGSVCIDLMGELPLDTETDFYDPLHATVKGAMKIGRFLHAKLSEAGVLQ